MSTTTTLDRGVHEIEDNYDVLAHRVVLTAITIDDLPTVPRGFESVAHAADEAMLSVLREDLS